MNNYQPRQEIRDEVAANMKSAGAAPEQVLTAA
jgi:hypothetical protein